MKEEMKGFLLIIKSFCVRNCKMFFFLQYDIFSFAADAA